jgi:hypothetical protein
VFTEALPSKWSYIGYSPLSFKIIDKTDKYIDPRRSSILHVASVVYIATQASLYTESFTPKNHDEETLVQNRTPRPVPLLSAARQSFVVMNKIPVPSDICQGCYADTKCLQTL